MRLNKQQSRLATLPGIAAAIGRRPRPSASRCSPDHGSKFPQSGDEVCRIGRVVRFLREIADGVYSRPSANRGPTVTI